jgi:hypothetical protein
MEEIPMKEFVFLSEQGDDENDGLSEDAPIRTAAKAISIANRTGRDIHVLGSGEMLQRLTAELELERTKKRS